MKVIQIIFLVGIILSSGITIIFTRPYFIKKIRALKEQSNENLERFFRNLDIGKFIKRNSLLNTLCLLRREYVKNSVSKTKDTDFFDQYILAVFLDFIDMQADGISFFLELIKGVQYVDPEIVLLIKKAISLRKDRVIELFEKSYLSYQDATPEWKLTFKDAVKHSYLQNAELSHIFYDRLKQDGVSILEESRG